MAKTKDDLVRRTLGLLGAIQAGQDPAAEDVTLVEGVIGPRLEDLALRRVTYIADVDDIPEAEFQWLAMLLAQDLAPDFGRPMDAGAMQLAEARLRALKANPPPLPRLRVEYF